MFLLQWVRGINLLKNNISVTVYFRKSILDEAIAKEFEKNGAKIVTGELPQNETSLAPKNRKKVREDIKRILDEGERFDIVHVNSSALGFSVTVLKEAYKAKVPIRISHSHGKNINNGWKNSYLWLMKLINRNLATKHAGCSKDAGKYLFNDVSEKNTKWVFIPNTIPADKYAFSEQTRKTGREELRVKNDEILLGATGMLVPIKNHLFLIELMYKIKKKGIKAKLIIFGEGEERANLEQQIQEKDLYNEVILYGTTNDVASWLSALDYYLMPSISEGLPIGAIEAQANGLYCLLSDRIPSDIDLSEKAIHLPINGNYDCWIDTILSLNKKERKREDGVSIVKKNGFDQSNTPYYIKQLYHIL